MTNPTVATVQRFWSLGSSARDLGSAMLMTCREAPAQPLANFVHSLRPADADDLDGMLATATEILGSASPRIILDDTTPHWARARLVQQDWRIEDELHLVLDTEDTLPDAPGLPIRPLDDTDAEWAQLRKLFRLDHVEEDEKANRPIRPESRTDDAITIRRALTRAGTQYFVAEEDGHFTGFTCAWPGDDGTGVVEDVFVHPESRYRGLATGLITTAAAHARQQGSRSVVIGADPTDTPKYLYARLGFEPTAITTALLPPSC